MKAKQWAFLAEPRKRSDGHGTERSRAEEWGENTPWPDFGPGRYLFDALMKLGAARADMTGRRAVDWPEIAAFNDACGPYQVWELSILRDMALAVLEGAKIGEDPMGRPPIDL